MSKIKKIILLSKKFNVYIKEYGLKAALQKVKRYLRYGNSTLKEVKNIEVRSREHEEYIEIAKSKVDSFKYRPLISIVVPVFNTPLDVLQEMIESVIGQIYENWQLCLVNASKENVELTQCLREYSQKDIRIKVVTLEENKGISNNTNMGIQEAEGEFIGLLDHDDIIEAEALFEVVKYLQDKEYDFFYSNKDMMSDTGEKYYSPFYKPDWTLDMLYSANYITHFCVIRKKVIEKVGYFDSNTDGAQDWDMFLKIGEVTDKICHIPRILYHWRMIESSTASGIGAKPYALAAQIRSVNNHFIRENIPATANFINKELAIIKIDYHIPQELKGCIVIKDEGNKKKLSKMLRAISRQEKIQNMDIIVISEMNQYINSERLNIKWIVGEARTVIECLNVAKKYSNADKMLYLQYSKLLSRYTVYELMQWLENHQIGLVGPKFIDKDNNIYSIGITNSMDGNEKLFNKEFRVTYNDFGYTEWYRTIYGVYFGCFAIKRECIDYLERVENEDGYYRLSNSSIGRFRSVYNPFAQIKV